MRSSLLKMRSSARLILLLLASCARAAHVPEHANGSTYVGATPLSLAPTDSGDVQFSLPIATAPAGGGFAPKLALSFSTKAASSNLLGTGFHVSGVSQITHCPATLATDGRVGAIAFDGGDRFCVGSERLIAIDGADGAEGGASKSVYDSATEDEEEDEEEEVMV